MSNDGWRRSLLGGFKLKILFAFISIKKIIFYRLNLVGKHKWNQTFLLWTSLSSFRHVKFQKTKSRTVIGNDRRGSTTVDPETKQGQNSISMRQRTSGGSGIVNGGREGGAWITHVGDLCLWRRWVRLALMALEQVAGRWLLRWMSVLLWSPDNLQTLGQC